jgi:acyl dehydratase
VIGRTIEELAVGDAVELTRVAWPEDVAAFVHAIGDDNPVHSDPAFAASTPFGRPIAPGMWTAGLISAAIGTRLPGPGTIYAKQDLKFLRPVYFGDVITARVEIVEVIADRNRIRLATTCTNEDGETVLTGEAWVLPPLEPVRYEEDGQGERAITSFWALEPIAWAGRTAALWYSAVAAGLASLSGPGNGTAPSQSTTPV